MPELFAITRNIITFNRVFKLKSELRVGHFFVKSYFAFFFLVDFTSRNSILFAKAPAQWRRACVVG